MDFHTLSRKELQTLCKKNKIPANLTNVAMADALAALHTVDGIEEFLDRPESESPRTTGRTATRRNPAKQPESSQPLTRTRRATARKATAETDQENKDVNLPPQTPSVPITRRRAQAASTRRKLDIEDEEKEKNEEVKCDDVQSTQKKKAASTAVRKGHSTRQSVRILEKNMAELKLTEPIKMDEDTLEEGPKEKIDEDKEESGLNSSERKSTEEDDDAVAEVDNAAKNVEDESQTETEVSMNDHLKGEEHEVVKVGDEKCSDENMAEFEEDNGDCQENHEKVENGLEKDYEMVKNENSMEEADEEKGDYDEDVLEGENKVVKNEEAPENEVVENECSMEEGGGNQVAKNESSMEEEGEKEVVVEVLDEKEVGKNESSVEGLDEKEIVKNERSMEEAHVNEIVETESSMEEETVVEMLDEKEIVKNESFMEDVHKYEVVNDDNSMEKVHEKCKGDSENVLEKEIEVLMNDDLKETHEVDEKKAAEDESSVEEVDENKTVNSGSSVEEADENEVIKEDIFVEKAREKCEGVDMVVNENFMEAADEESNNKEDMGDEGSENVIQNETEVPNSDNLKEDYEDVKNDNYAEEADEKCNICGLEIDYDGKPENVAELVLSESHLEQKQDMVEQVVDKMQSEDAASVEEGNFLANNLMSSSPAEISTNHTDEIKNEILIDVEVTESEDFATAAHNETRLSAEVCESNESSTLYDVHITHITPEVEFAGGNLELPPPSPHMTLVTPKMELLSHPSPFIKGLAASPLAADRLPQFSCQKSSAKRESTLRRTTSLSDNKDNLDKSDKVEQNTDKENKSKEITKENAVSLDDKSLRQLTKMLKEKRESTLRRTTSLSDNKDNLDKSDKVEQNTDKENKSKEITKENAVPLDDKSLRQLTKMLKEKLTLKNSKKEISQAGKAARPALQALPSNNIAVKETETN